MRTNELYGAVANTVDIQKEAEVSKSVVQARVLPENSLEILVSLEFFDLD